MHAVHLLSTPMGSESVSKLVKIRCFPVVEDVAVTACNARADINALWMIFGVVRCLYLVVKVGRWFRLAFILPMFSAILSSTVYDIVFKHDARS
jgi:hypothetical protein